MVRVWLGYSERAAGTWALEEVGDVMDLELGAALGALTLYPAHRGRHLVPDQVLSIVGVRKRHQLPACLPAPLIPKQGSACPA